MVITEKDIKLHKLMKTMLQSIVDVKGTGSDLEVVFKHYAGLHDQSMHGNRYGSTVNDAGEVVASLVHGGNLRQRSVTDREGNVVDAEHFRQETGHARNLEANRLADAQRNAEERHALGTDKTWKWPVGKRSATNIETVDDFKANFQQINLDDSKLNTTDIKVLNAANASMKNLEKGLPDMVGKVSSLTFDNLANSQGKGDNFGRMTLSKDGTIKMTLSSALTNSPTSANHALIAAAEAGAQPKGVVSLEYPMEKVIGKGVSTYLSKSEAVHVSCKDADGKEIFIFDERDGTGTVSADTQHISRILEPEVSAKTNLFGTDVNNFKASTGKHDYQNTFATLYAAPAAGSEELMGDKSVQKFSSYITSVMEKQGGVSKSEAVSLQSLKLKATAAGATDNDVMTYRNAQAALTQYRKQTGLTKDAVSKAYANIHGRTATTTTTTVAPAPAPAPAKPTI